MTTSSSTVVKNASVLLVAQLVTWALTFLLTIFQPRFLGPEATGELYLAIALWSLAGVFIGFGMDTLLTKSIARDASSPVKLLGTSLWLRFLAYPVSGVVITLYMMMAGFSLQTMLVVHVIGVSVFIWQLIGGVQAVLQGLEIMEYISLSTIVSKAINTFFGIGVLLLGFRLISLAVVMIVSALSCLVIQLFYLNRVQRLSFRLNLSEAVPILRASLPYVVGTLILSAYHNINTVILGAYMDTAQVGWFSTAATLFGTLLFLPVAFATATFPSLSRAHVHSPTDLPVMFRKSIDLLILGSVPIGLGLTAIAGPLVQLLYGPEFAPSVPVLQVLGVTLIFMYFNILIGQYFTSTDKQNTWTACIAIFTVVMILATIFLIPMSAARLGNGAIGAAVGLLLAEAGMAIIGLFLLRNLLSWSTAWMALRVSLLGLLMVAAVWALREQFIAIQVLAGAFVYGLGVALLRLVPPDDLRLLWNFSLRLRKRFQRRRVPTESASLEAPPN